MHRCKSHIKKDDKVKVITGKDSGKIGKVLKVNRKKQRVLVENINIVKRHTRPSASNRQQIKANPHHPAVGDYTQIILAVSKGPDRVRWRTGAGAQDLPGKTGRARGVGGRNPRGLEIALACRPAEENVTQWISKSCFLSRNSTT